MFLLEVKREEPVTDNPNGPNWLPYRIIGANTIRLALTVETRIPKGYISRLVRITPIRSNDIAERIRSIWGN